MENRPFAKEYSRFHLLLASCLGTALFVGTMLFLGKTDFHDQNVLCTLAAFIAWIVMCAFYVTPFTRGKNTASLKSMEAVGGNAWKVALAGVAAVLVSSIFLPPGSLEVGSPTSLALTVVTVAAFMILPTSVTLAGFIILIARYIKPIR